MRTALVPLALLMACGDGGAVMPPDATPAPDAEILIDAALPDAPPPPPGTACSVAIDVTADTEPRAGDTMLAGNVNEASCSGGSAAAPDLYYKFEAGTSPVDLIVDVVTDESGATPFDVVLSARSDCNDLEAELACMDVWWSERLEVLGATGTVYLLVDGTEEFGGLPQGMFTIRVTTRAVADMGDPCDPAGVTSRCAAGLTCDAGTCETTDPALACAAAPDLTADLADGTASVTDTIHLYDSDFYAGPCSLQQTGAEPERIYAFTLAATSNVTASTDDPTGTTFDTALYLRAGACDAADLACNDDVDPDAENYRSTLTATGLDPGTYYLFVDTSSYFVYTTGAGVETPRAFHLTVNVTTP